MAKTSPGGERPSDPSAAQGSDRLRVGIIGAGTWGAVHAKVYSGIPEVELVALADRDEAKAAKLAGDRGLQAAVYGDYRKLLEDETIDAVSIVVPDFLHTEVVLETVRRGKHALIEKPLTTEVDEAVRCVDEMKASGNTYMVDFHLRWMTPFYRAHELIRQGAIGRPVFCSFEQSNTTDIPLKMLGWASRSNVLWFLGIHSVDMLQWFFASRVARVYARSVQGVLRKLGVETDDFFITTLEFESGAVASLENSWILPGTYPAPAACRCRVSGTEGVLEADIINSGALRYTSTGGTQDVNLFGLNRIDDRFTGSPDRSIRHFVRSVLTHSPPLVTLEDALSTVKVIRAAFQSAREGRPIEV